MLPDLHHTSGNLRHLTPTRDSAACTRAASRLLTGSGMQVEETVGNKTELITEVASVYNLTSNSYRPVRIRDAPFCAGHIYGPTVCPLPLCSRLAALQWLMAAAASWLSCKLADQASRAGSNCTGIACRGTA